MKKQIIQSVKGTRDFYRSRCGCGRGSTTTSALSRSDSATEYEGPILEPDCVVRSPSRARSW